MLDFRIAAKHLINYTLLQKQERINVITKSVNQYPNNKAQTSDGIQSLEKIGNNLVVFDVMLLSKQESNADLFFKDYVTIILIYITYPTAISISQKNSS